MVYYISSALSEKLFNDLLSVNTCFSKDTSNIITFINTLIEQEIDDNNNQTYIVRNWPTNEMFKYNYKKYKLKPVELIKWCLLLTYVNVVKPVDDKEIIKLKKIFDANINNYEVDKCGWMRSFYNLVTKNKDVCSPSQMFKWYCVFINEPSSGVAYMFNKYNCDNPKLVYDWFTNFGKQIVELKLNPYNVGNQITKYCVAFSFIPVDDAIRYLQEFEDKINNAMIKHYLSVQNKNIG